jgi:queuine tRNA-ribosyltransferase
VTLPFTIQAQAGPARLGRIETAHGPVETPAFMPVGTAGTVKAVPQEMLEDLGSQENGSQKDGSQVGGSQEDGPEKLRAQIILGNTYHLYLRPGHELVRRMGGLHRFMSWNHALLTDSGGFQVFSLSELRKVSEEGVSFRSHLDGTSHLFTPERSMEIQIALGADIVMAFDECTEHPAEKERARRSMEMILRRISMRRRGALNPTLCAKTAQRMGHPGTETRRRAGPRRCSGLSREGCMPICGGSRRSGPWSWIFPGMRLAG